jgi:small subunit ribosomal protein S17
MTLRGGSIVEQTNKKTFTGRVVSDKTEKTISVLVESYKIHPLYGKRVKYSKKYSTHDELNEAKVGDIVRIEECRPMSKTKKFRLVEIVEKAVVI